MSKYRLHQPKKKRTKTTLLCKRKTKKKTLIGTKCYKENMFTKNRSKTNCGGSQRGFSPLHLHLFSSHTQELFRHDLSADVPHLHFELPASGRLLNRHSTHCEHIHKICLLRLLRCLTPRTNNGQKDPKKRTNTTEEVTKTCWMFFWNEVSEVASLSCPMLLPHLSSASSGASV